MEEELVTTEQTSEPVAESLSPADQLNQNYEALVKQQQAQIEQLMKQQEITNKVNQQLTKKVAQMSETQQNINPNEHGVDKVLREQFRFENSINPKSNYDDSLNEKANTLATGWLQYNKSKGLSNEEIATKYKKMVSYLNKGRGPHEVI